MDLSAVSFDDITLVIASLIAVYFLWRDNQKLREAYRLEIEDHKKTLRDFNEGKLFDQGARIRVCEDRLSIPRDEKYKYMPPLRDNERAALANLDMTPEHQFSDAASERDRKS